MKRRWAILLASAAAAAVLYAALRPEPAQQHLGQVDAREPVAVKVTEAHPVVAERRLQASGHLRAEIELPAITPFPGTVKEVLYKQGDAVAAGAVVAVVESIELIERLRSSETALQRAYADLRESEDRLADAEKQLGRTRELYGKDLIARRDVAEAERVVETTRAEKDLAGSKVEQRKAAVAQARYLLSLTRITAPLSGIVTRRLVQPGHRVAAAAQLLTVANIATLSVAVELSGPVTDWLRPATRLEVFVDAFPTRPFSGTIIRVTEGGPSGTKRTLEARVANQDAMLKPGMKVLVELPVNESPNVLVVPKEAVFELERRKYLYTVDDDKARLKQVDTGWEKAGQIAITENLTNGEKVVIWSRDRLQPDVPVRIVE